MKKLFQVACTLLLSSTLSAQTITIDGANTDWSEVPMLTEPGAAGPVVKMVVPQDGLTLPEGTAYALMVEGDHEQILAGYPVIYTDADKSNTTGTANWFCPTMGYDYEMAIWADMSIFANNNEGSIREMAVKLSAFSDALKFTGSISAWLTFDWGKLYIPTTPDEDGWKWSENSYHPMYVKPYAYADLKGTHTAANAYATHQVLTPGEALNMKIVGSANDTLVWASWTVELTKPATYVITADVTSTNIATVDLYLVDVATNNIVATFVSADVWAPTGSTVYGEWDLSDVPAGKYMLKMKNHAAWSDMVLKSVTLVRSCSVNITTQDNNMGSVIVDKEIVNDNQISIIATANANQGYHFTQWSDGNTDNPRSIVLTQDTSFVAHFAPNNYAISTQSSDAERGTTSGNVTTTYLDYVTISATANYGYHFTQWNDGNTDNPRQVQATEDKTYTAYFDKNTYHITKNYDSNQGYVNGSTSGEYLDNITLTAKPNYGYHFVRWSDSNTDNPRSLVLTQDTILTAEFAPNNYTISTQCNDTERGTTSEDITVAYLDYVTISATANYGYHFTQWNDGNTDNPRQVQVTEDKTYTAYFDKNTYHITKNYDSNQGYVNGSISGAYLDNITLTAEANYGYHFVQWSDGETDNPRSFVLTQDTTFAAEFAPNNYTISTQSSDTERGTTSGDITVAYLDYVTISVTANYGYHFSRWNDYNYDNPRQVQATEDKIYTAYFDKNTYHITKNYDSNQGYVNGSTSGEYLDNITLTAEPNHGYHFTQWADGNTDNPRTIILTQDTIMMAEFAQSYSGQCGDNLYWAYDNTIQKLSISGMGDMYDYTATTQPWLLFKEEIMAVDIINTATSIGASAFEGCKRLGSVTIGVNIEDIGANAFAGCTRLYDIYCYPIYPPFVETSSFANYNVYLYVPCLNIREYEMDIVWGNFKYIQCMGAEGEEIEDGTVEVTTSTNSVTITWPTEENANTYIIEIKKDGVVFCRLTFNADGQLLNISFVPGRDGNHPAQFATKTTNGLRFTVTGLEESTNYTYDIISKDENNESIETYSGEFKTQSNTPTDVGNLDASTSNVHKLLRNGHLIIVRDGVEYNTMGQEM